jgi:hypothetical protein
MHLFMEIFVNYPVMSYAVIGKTLSLRKLKS